MSASISFSISVSISVSADNFYTTIGYRIIGKFHIGATSTTVHLYTYKYSVLQQYHKQSWYIYANFLQTITVVLYMY